MNNNILLNDRALIFEPHFSGQRELPFIFHKGLQYAHGRGCIPNLHQNIELLHFTEGHGSVRYNGQLLAVSQGDMIVINAYAPHQVLSQDKLVCDCLIIGDDFCREHGIDTTRLQFTPFLRDTHLAALFNAAFQEYAGEGGFRQARIKCAVLQLLICLCQNYSCTKTADIPEHRCFESVQIAVEYIKKNLHRRITVDEVAEQAGFSKFYFLRLFKRITGCTIIGYTNLLRCEYAKELFKTGSHTVKETALLCGFDNLSHFTNVFKKHTGCLPHVYKAQGGTDL